VGIDWAAASDQELWSQAANELAGEAFGELFERHADRVYAHCFTRTGSWSMAEDLVSAVFLQAWRRRGDVRFSGDSALPWLLGVANNATRNAQRTLRRYRLLLAKLPPAGEEADIAPDAEDRVDQERLAQRVLRAMGRLRQSEREVIALCDWAGLSYAEAAVAMGVPEGTVRSRLSRAREHLRALASDLPERCQPTSEDPSSPEAQDELLPAGADAGPAGSPKGCGTASARGAGRPFAVAPMAPSSGDDRRGGGSHRHHLGGRRSDGVSAGHRQDQGTLLHRRGRECWPGLLHDGEGRRQARHQGACAKRPQRLRCVVPDRGAAGRTPHDFAPGKTQISRTQARSLRLAERYGRRIPRSVWDLRPSRTSPSSRTAVIRLTPPAARCGGPGSLSQTGAVVPYPDRLC
jgi:RNA polymerase sigma-70 factor (ECF subfamily)